MPQTSDSRAQGQASPSEAAPPPPPHRRRSLWLSGSASLPFTVRFNLTFASASHLATLMVLCIIVACIVRAPSHYTALHSILRRYAAFVLGDLLWRHACRRSPHGGSYIRWRHLALPAFALGDILLARHQVVRAGVEATIGRHTGGAGVLMLVLASRALSNLMVWFLCHPITYALPLQLAIVYQHMQANWGSCDSILAAEATAGALVHRIATALELSQLGGLAAAARSQPLTPAEECRAVLAYQQLCFSLAAPAIVAAVVETRLWLRHQADRQECGLSPEGGWQQRWYRVLQALLLGHDWGHVAVLSWLLSGVLYLAAAALSVD